MFFVIFVYILVSSLCKFFFYWVRTGIFLVSHAIKFFNFARVPVNYISLKRHISWEICLVHGSTQSARAYSRNVSMYCLLKTMKAMRRYSQKVKTNSLFNETNGDFIYPMHATLMINIVSGSLVTLYCFEICFQIQSWQWCSCCFSLGYISPLFFIAKFCVRYSIVVLLILCTISFDLKAEVRWVAVWLYFRK